MRAPHIVKPYALTMAIETSGTFDDYWQMRPGQLRKNLRRYRQRAEKRFATREFLIISAPEQIEAAVKRNGEIESAGWKGKAGTAIHADNQQGRFYADVLVQFARQGQAQALELQLDDRIVASRLLICNDNMAIILKTTYDETLADIAPGLQHLQETLQHFFSEKKQPRIEFYTNANRDQAEWATSLRYIRHHQIFRNESLAGLHALGRRARNALASKADEQTVFNPYEIASYPSVKALPPCAADLFSQAEKTSPELSSAWFANLQETVFKAADTVRYYMLSLRGNPGAILPLRFENKGLQHSIESLGNFYTSLYAPILPRPSDALELIPLLKAALQDQPDTSVMRFAPLDPDAPGFEALLSALWSLGWIPFRFFRFGNWYHLVSQDWQSYFAALPGQLRNTIKRKGRKFTAAGGTFEIVTTPDQVDRAITAFTQVYAKSWKKPEPYPAFVPSLIRWLASKGWLRLGLAHLAGQPIAAQLWIVSHDKASIYKLTYDEAFSEYAPGTLLTAHMMAHVIDHDQVKEVDYLIGDDEYKKDWMSFRRERWGIVAYNLSTLYGTSLFSIEIFRRVMLSFLRNRFISKGFQIFKKTRPQAIVVGLCAHGLALARDLHHHGISVYALETNKKLPGTHTNSAIIQYANDINGPELITSLLHFARQFGFIAKPVLYLTNDRMVRIIGEHADEITRYFHLSWAHCSSYILRYLNKHNIEERCRSVGLNYPRSVLLTRAESIEHDLSALVPPIILKPVQPLSLFKTLMLDSVAAIKNHRNTVAQCLPVLAQEFIPGDDRKIRFGALYLDHGKVLARFEGRKFLSRPMGHTVIGISEPDDRIHELTVRFFDGLEISGPVSLEMKEAPDGSLWVIEPTVGRTDFWVDLCIANGVDLPFIEYSNQTGIAFPPSHQTRQTIWINSERYPWAVFWLLRYTPLLLIQQSLRDVYFDLKDIKPAFVARLAFFTNLLERLWDKIAKFFDRH